MPCHIACGSFHSLLLDNEGNVLGCGSITSGQLGSRMQTVSRFTVLSTPPNAVSVHAGGSNSFIIDEFGDVFGAGINHCKQLGVNSSQLVVTAFLKVPNKIASSEVKIKDISIGDAHSLFLDTNGDVSVSGSDYYGQCGTGIIKETERGVIPGLRKISYVHSIVSIAAGFGHSLMLDDCGKVWSVGDNSQGQLGYTTENYFSSKPECIHELPQVRSISAGHKTSLFLTDSGEVFICGFDVSADKTNVFIPIPVKCSVNVPKLPLIDSILAVAKHCILLDDRGNIWVTGSNLYGQLGNGRTGYTVTGFSMLEDLPEFDQIAGGPSHSLFLDIEGKLWGCGSNNQSCLSGIGHASVPKIIIDIPKISIRIHQSRQKSA